MGKLIHWLANFVNEVKKSDVGTSKLAMPWSIFPSEFERLKTSSYKLKFERCLEINAQ